MGHRNSVFVSYSRKDKNLVLPVVKAQEGLQWAAFIDIDHTPLGSDWEKEHGQNIEYSDRLLLCWSKNSAISENVEREWRHALECGTDIVPVLLDDSPLHRDLARFHAVDLREYIRSNCRPRSINSGLHGAFILGTSALLFLTQAYSISEHGIRGGMVFLIIVSLVAALVGWNIVQNWIKWVQLKNFVDIMVIHDLQKRHQSRSGKENSAK
jgi:hypothetical protein